MAAWAGTRRAQATHGICGVVPAEWSVAVVVTAANTDDGHGFSRVLASFLVSGDKRLRKG